MADHECCKITHWPPVLNPPPKVSFRIKLFKCNHVRYQVSHVMRKPVYAIQSDQFFNFVVRCFDSIIPIVAKPKVSSLSLVSVAEQTGLSFTWSHTTEDRFSRDETQIKLVLMRAITLSLVNLSRVLGVKHLLRPRSFSMSLTVTRKGCNCWTHEHR